MDPQADYLRYRTYVFLEGGPKTEGAITDKLVNDRLRHMIAVRLGARGYAPAASGQPADLGVHYSGKVVPKQSVLMVGRPGPYDYSWGRTEIGGYDTMDYREGTLYIDLVDLATNRLLWRARISEAFSAGYSRRQLEEDGERAGEGIREAAAAPLKTGAATHVTGAEIMPRRLQELGLRRAGGCDGCVRDRVPARRPSRR